MDGLIRAILGEEEVAKLGLLLFAALGGGDLHGGDDSLGRTEAWLSDGGDPEAEAAEVVLAVLEGGDDLDGQGGSALGGHGFRR